MAQQRSTTFAAWLPTAALASGARWPDVRLTRTAFGEALSGEEINRLPTLSAIWAILNDLVSLIRAFLCPCPVRLVLKSLPHLGDTCHCWQH